MTTERASDAVPFNDSDFNRLRIATISVRDCPLGRCFSRWEYAESRLAESERQRDEAVGLLRRYAIDREILGSLESDSRAFLALVQSNEGTASIASEKEGE